MLSKNSRCIVLATVAFLQASLLGAASVNPCNLNVNPRKPRWAAAIDQTKLHEFIQAYPEEYRPAAQLIAKNIRHVTHAEFVKALDQSLTSLLDKLPRNRHYVILDYPTEKSNGWVAQIAVQILRSKRGQPPRNEGKTFSAVDTEEKLQRHLSTNPGSEWIQVDDVAIGGNQLAYDFEDLSGQGFIVIPFVTRTALRRISQSRRSAQIVSNQVVPTFGELVANADNPTQKAVRALFGSNADDRALVYFDHHIPDEVSTPSLDVRFKDSGDLASVLNGAVPDRRGVFKMFVPFIKTPDKPYG